LWLGLSIAEIVLFSRLIGLPALIFVILANNNYRVGNIEGFQSKLKLAQIFLIIGLIIGIILDIGIFVDKFYYFM
jgi:hypothetical protein